MQDRHISLRIPVVNRESLTFLENFSVSLIAGGKLLHPNGGRVVN
jgi:hypothetical protein